MMRANAVSAVTRNDPASIVLRSDLRQMEAVERQDRALLRFDPIDAVRVACVGHREHAHRIGAQHHARIERRDVARLRVAVSAVAVPAVPASRRGISRPDAFRSPATVARTPVPPGDFAAKLPTGARRTVIASTRLAIGTTGQSGCALERLGVQLAAAIDHRMDRHAPAPCCRDAARPRQTRVRTAGRGSPARRSGRRRASPGRWSRSGRAGNRAGCGHRTCESRRAASAAASSCRVSWNSRSSPRSDVSAGDQVEPVDAGRLDQLRRLDVAGEDRLRLILAPCASPSRKLDAACGSRSHSKVRRADERRRAPGEIDRQRGLPDAALQAVDRDRRHPVIVAQSDYIRKTIAPASIGPARRKGRRIAPPA